MPGSVIAIARICSPEAMPGSQRACCSSLAEAMMYGRQTSVCSSGPANAVTDAGARRLLAEHDIEAPVLDARAAELLRDVHGQEAVPGGLGEQLARDDLVLLPLRDVRDDLGGEELAKLSR